MEEHRPFTSASFRHINA